MPEYLSPGVYVEEVDTGPVPIEGVSTSTVGAVGVTARGPTSGKPVLITSFADFQRTFGGSVPDPTGAQKDAWLGDQTEGGSWWTFPLAVKGFFDNGGQRMYVKRVFTGGGLPLAAQTAANTAVAASGGLARGLVSEILSDAVADGNPIALKLRHLIGISHNTAVTLRNGDTGQQIGPGYTVSAYDPVTSRVTLNAPLSANTDVRASRGDQVIVITPVAAAAGASHFSVAAKERGVHGNSINVRARPMVGATLSLLPDPVNGGAAARTTVQALAADVNPVNPWTVTVPAGGLAGFANNDTVMILGHSYLISAVNAAAGTFTLGPLPAHTQWVGGTPVQRLRAATNPAAAVNQVNVWGANQLYPNAFVELDNGMDKERLQVAAINGDVVTLSANLANHYLEGQRLRVIEVEVATQYVTETGVEVDETFANLRLSGQAGDANYIVTRVNAGSALVNFSDNNIAPQIALAALPCPLNGQWLDLANGDDLIDQLSVDDFVGADNGSGNRTGIQALEDIDLVSICVVPGLWSRTVLNALIIHCETLKYRFGILDVPDNLSIQKVSDFRAVFDTKYAALYYPWIVVRDPVAKKDVRLAPSAHMAGIYARVDVARGVYKAPANEVIQGISNLGADINKREQDILNPLNINALRYFPDRGNRVWGARCVTSDSDWKYINVRRLFIYIEASIDKATQWVVFEPNDDATWARVRLSINNFLESTWRSGALFGTTAAQAYFVKCDRTTMTQDDIDNGRLICVIGIAPVKPAEFVIFRIQQKTQDLTTT